jgi:hypothetical protein
MKVRLTCLVIMLFVMSSSTFAQTANPISAGTKHTYELVRGYLLAAINKMPEEHYAFRPVPEERSFAQLVGHLADANAALCGLVGEAKPPLGGIEASKKSKAEVVKALTDAFAFCDEVYGKMTDTTGAALVKFVAGGAISRRPEEMSRLSTLEYNTHHNFEGYGMLALYMRMKGIVPPSSDTPSPLVERKAISVSPGTLSKYVGNYEVQPGTTIVITREGNQLLGQMNGPIGPLTDRGPIPIFAESETRFFSRVVDAQIDFTKDDKGLVTGAVLHLYGRDQKAVRKP